MEYLEKELEAPLWLCFSLGYILFIFEEKIFFNFFRRKFFHRNLGFPIFDEGSDIFQKSSKKSGFFFSKIENLIFFIIEKIIKNKYLGLR